MPHVEIKIYKGRTEEQKQKCADMVAKAISKSLGCNLSSVSISIKDIEPDNWKEDVYDKEIINSKTLYKKPGYSYDK